MSLKSFSITYIDSLNKVLKKVDYNEVEKLYNLINKTQGKIYIIGNGGSASTASHMANDFAIGLKLRNIKPFDVISLCDNAAVTFAIANDTDFDNIFYLQLKDILKKEDIVIAISCSGNSPNIVKAINYAKEVGSTIVGFSGFDGGYLKQLSDIKIHVESEKGSYGLVEDAHLIINHMLFTYFNKNKEA